VHPSQLQPLALPHKVIQTVFMQVFTAKPAVKAEHDTTHPVYSAAAPKASTLTAHPLHAHVWRACACLSRHLATARRHCRSKSCLSYLAHTRFAERGYSVWPPPW